MVITRILNEKLTVKAAGRSENILMSIDLSQSKKKKKISVLILEAFTFLMLYLAI